MHEDKVSFKTTTKFLKAKEMIHKVMELKLYFTESRFALGQQYE